jgi:hypothetical protein
MGKCEMENLSSEAIKRYAYREAGHATMFYLIVNGFIEKYVPFNLN